mmetsp:Transcript_8649/g.11930  ORF Transcript_8649/g.11930 Transcript_8649/m.11930 type:complete len:98 (-) Transcript_8649:316-609(-)
MEKLLGMYRAPALPKLTDLPKASEVNAFKPIFRWPTIADLVTMGLNEPLKLEEVRTSGKDREWMETIQLVFQKGIKSPTFSVHERNSKNDVETDRKE